MTTKRLKWSHEGLIYERVIDVETSEIVTAGILPPLGSVRHPPNIYKEMNKPVTDFDLDTPSAMASHVADLCICLHSRQQHHQILGDPSPVWREPEQEPFSFGRDTSVDLVTDMCSSAGCPCRRFNPVSAKESRHAYRRGMSVYRRRLVDLRQGDMVLTGWAPPVGRVRLLALLEERSGAMVSTVKSKRQVGEVIGRQHWTIQSWEIRTDLGVSVPQLGGVYVGVIRS